MIEGDQVVVRDHQREPLRVAHDDQVVAGRLSGLEQDPELREELVVGLDDLLVVHRDALLLLEELQRRVDALAVVLGLVDVQRPVPERELAGDLLRRPVEAAGGPRGAAHGRRRFLRGPAARRQEPGETQTGRAHPRVPEEAASRHAGLDQPPQQREVEIVAVRHRAFHPPLPGVPRRPGRPAVAGRFVPVQATVEETLREGRRHDDSAERSTRAADQPDELAREGDLAIRRMRDDPADYELFVRWRNEPHVAEWWTTDDDPTPMTLDHVVEQYGPRAEDGSWVTGCIITVGDRAIGYTQFYPWSGAADEAREMGITDVDGSYGLDIFIGEPDADRHRARLARGGPALPLPLRGAGCDERRAPHPGRQRSRAPCLREGGVPEGRADPRHRCRERRAADELADGPRPASGMMQPA